MKLLTLQLQLLFFACLVFCQLVGKNWFDEGLYCVLKSMWLAKVRQSLTMSSCQVRGPKQAKYIFIITPFMPVSIYRIDVLIHLTAISMDLLQHHSPTSLFFPVEVPKLNSLHVIWLKGALICKSSGYLHFSPTHAWDITPVSVSKVLMLLKIHRAII